MGKIGQASMRPLPQRDAVRELLVGSDDLRQAAEVILGRLDIADLVGGSNVQDKAAEVKALLLYACLTSKAREALLITSLKVASSYAMFPVPFVAYFSFMQAYQYQLVSAQ